MAVRIPTYFSHSYRPEDRAVNKALWRPFAAKGFAFAVDPATELSSHTHLETMMVRSGAFVAVVNHRRDNPPRYCSSFILAEIGLAVQAKTPKLLLVDERVPAREFDALSRDECVRLDLASPSNYGQKLKGHIENLATRALGALDYTSRPRNRVALLVPRTKRDEAYGGKEIREAMLRCIQLQGMIGEEMEVPREHNLHFASLLGAYECVVLDVRANQWLPSWVFAYLYGRFVPSVKLVNVRPKELASSIELPPLVCGLRMSDSEPGVESVIYWRDSADLVDQLARALKRVGARGTELRTGAEAATYFDSLGRQPARVFVSNAGSANDFADKLCALLLRQNIEVWQYKQPDAIRTAADWPDTIRRELEQCNVFVALLDRQYPKSEWCRKEMRRARERKATAELSLLPYQIDAQLGGKEIGKLIGTMQAPPVHRNPGRAHQAILKDVDRVLRPSQGDDWRLREPLLLGASREVIVDALRYVPRARYAKLLRGLRDAGVTVSFTPEKANPQPRYAAAALLRSVQESKTELSGPGFASRTSALVSLLAEASEPRRKVELKKLLGRIEETMELRGLPGGRSVRTTEED